MGLNAVRGHAREGLIEGVPDVGGMAQAQIPPLPPSVGRDGGPHHLRYLGQVEPGRAVQKGYGNLWVLAAFAVVAFVAIGGAVYFGVLAQSEVHVTLSTVTTTVSTCQSPGSWAGGATEDVLYTFTVTNSGTRGALVIIYLYANGEWIGTTTSITVPAGATVPVSDTVTGLPCGPVTGTASIANTSPIR